MCCKMPNSLGWSWNELDCWWGHPLQRICASSMPCIVLYISCLLLALAWHWFFSFLARLQIANLVVICCPVCPTWRAMECRLEGWQGGCRVVAGQYSWPAQHTLMALTSPLLQIAAIMQQRFLGKHTPNCMRCGSRGVPASGLGGRGGV